MRPILLGNFIPPVTGVNGVPSSVVANLFDDSGNFRPRVGSGAKRPRSAVGGGAGFHFDMTGPSETYNFPARPSLDVAHIKELLVDASKWASIIRDKMGGDGVDEATKVFSNMNLALFNIIQAIVEKAIEPMSTPVPAAPAIPTAPKPPAGVRELKEALVAAETTAIVYDADLGPVSLANRHKLSCAFTAGLKDSAVRVAGAKGAEPAEAWRLVNEAVSVVSDMTFIGETSGPAKPRRGESNPSITGKTMPIRLTFDDKDSRAFAERTLREKCGLRVTPSLPFQLRTQQSALYEEIRKNFKDDKISDVQIMIRTCPDTLSFVVKKKQTGVDTRWVVHRRVPIDPTCMVSVGSATVLTGASSSAPMTG